MLSAVLAVSRSGAAHADATDEEAVANKELVKEVVDKTKPAAPGGGSDMHKVLSSVGCQHRRQLATVACIKWCACNAQHVACRYVRLLWVGQPTHQLWWIWRQCSGGCQVSNGSHVKHGSSPSNDLVDGA
jgi:hypothetical protein